MFTVFGNFHEQTFTPEILSAQGNLYLESLCALYVIFHSVFFSYPIHVRIQDTQFTSVWTGGNLTSGALQLLHKNSTFHPPQHDCEQ